MLRFECFPWLLCCALVACDGPAPSAPAAQEPASAPAAVQPEEPIAPPVQMLEPVDLWKGGEVVGKVDAQGRDQAGNFVLDLGEDWTPYLFSDGVADDGRDLPHAFKPTYLKLAQEKFLGWRKPRLKTGEKPAALTRHFERAKRDRYLELYGVLPTLGVLRERLRVMLTLDCASGLDLSLLQDFEGVIPYKISGGRKWKQKARQTRFDYLRLRRAVAGMLTKYGISDPSELKYAAIAAADRYPLRRYRRSQAAHLDVVERIQERLICEGYLKMNKRDARGILDWGTHEALARFERRHRVYGWGFVGKQTLARLRKTPAELERQSVLRILTERAMLSLGVLEDGSGAVLTRSSSYEDLAGKAAPVPNIEMQLRASIEQNLGLQTPEKLLAWLDTQLGDQPPARKLVALPSPALPSYYSDDMDLFIEVDRGDIWYEFPYTPQGKERAQPVVRRPRSTIFVRHRGKRVALARFGTTVGGWRSEFLDGNLWWKYKNSPVGDRIWKNIVSAPVWLPPDTTPPSSLARRKRNRQADDPIIYEVNYDETGPGYASAYGLVAAYHKKYAKKSSGEYVVTGDEGIRMHGSVDYMSIMRRHSHGCHRLHNHIAVRLMSFVLKRRPHLRRGHHAVSYRLPFEHEEEEHTVAINRGGYVFTLQEPLHVNVLEGRIRPTDGAVQKPIQTPIPKYNRELGAFLLPDGGAVEPSRDGILLRVATPLPDGGVLPVPVPGEEPAAVGTSADPGIEAPVPAEGSPVPPSPSGSLPAATVPAPVVSPENPVRGR